tara:strand:- start:571 stop:1158 length:588 start_codon:yes stop_codon:yes gene_type:complete
MISDSPPERELEWTDEGIQSSKNLINRIERYFLNEKNYNDNQQIKQIEKYLDQMEKNILSFSFNKCVANIYTLFNYLEKNNIFLGNNDLSKKIIISLFPILPRLSNSIHQELFGQSINNNLWPDIDQNLLVEDDLVLPIQIKGKLVTTINTKKGYEEKNLLETIYKIDKIKNKLKEKKILKVINVQDKIINIITN